MSTTLSQQKRARRASSRRVGRVTVYRRGKIWYLYYSERGRRIRRRVGASLDDARMLAAQVNAQLATGSRAMMTFEQISVEELRRRWLDHHEHVLRSSIATIRRYRSATEHLLRFTSQACPVTSVDKITASDIERFVRFLREIKVAPNGHPNTAKRHLRDRGIVFILEACRTLFNYAAKHRHLPPYHENPFAQIEIDRIPIEDAKPFVGFTEAQERTFLQACDDWQFPIFATLLLTGLRPGELTHLLLPADLDLEACLLRIRNKPDLGWQIKTRNDRVIPLIPELAEVLRLFRGQRDRGTLFIRRRFWRGDVPPLATLTRPGLRTELEHRAREMPKSGGASSERVYRQAAARSIWRDLGAIRTDRIREEFMRLTRKIGMSEVTAVKTTRHLFATCLQDANVDPLIRNQLMGHAPSGGGAATVGLGMTGIYTHTRPETLRRQLESALRGRPAVSVARAWIKKQLHGRMRRETA